MPAQRPRAAFEPISPDLDIPALVDATPNFEFATKIHCNAIDRMGLGAFEKLVQLCVVQGGTPLVVEGFNESLDSSIFSEKWLRTHHGGKTEIARNLTTKSDLPLTIGHYLKNMHLLTNQWTAFNYKDANLQRIYLKDIDCPPLWHDHLKRQIPPPVFYFNETPEAYDGPGFASASIPDESEAGVRIAKAGDLMSCLPPDMRAENLMCYIGHEGTYTPSHQEMCASIGHNIMVEASDGSMEYGKPIKPGSSLWFMTESKDRRVVSEYWMSTLGHDIDIENHFAQMNAWKAAPFKTYIVEQSPGDLILIPPLAAHQVWNRGTRTMKVAWNRITVETLKMALTEALPHARMVCRDEQYKNKAIVFYSLERYSNLLCHVDEYNIDNPEVRQLINDFQHLFTLYTHILLSESFSPRLPVEKDVEFTAFDSNITCSYCRGNIFNRFLTCPSCIGPPTLEGEDTYDVCMECYAMGRSCACISNLKWVEQFSWEELTTKYEVWRQQILGLTRELNEPYQKFSAEREGMGKKSLAEICQEQLKVRPWIDITKPAVKKIGKVSDSETTSPARKKRKTGRRNTPQGTGHCHICKCAEPLWKLVSCSYCKLNYCYGSLYRAFSIQPQNAMEKYHWMCPRCQRICICAACRRDHTMTPFEPTSTVLGHDTKKIADLRSVESLVNFRHSNLKWFEKTGVDDETRLSKRQKEAEEERSQSFIDHAIQLEEIPQASNFEDIPVDPSLEQLLLTPPESNV
ncbi:putative JmjC domain protein [Aspergillus glaucus CBS 516.65]|uniref:JmjC domain-containing protein n=1 Tax=Aspergillus glaucus CBS 516.65 TaxID=1160497 RepID=A0A1L9VTM0_ASPGL|nr:hypothetical protein ASPGLDRAFT_120634 [Aspergillus glaucus CBS 516.65]OJJ87278.1 hypothetical protein ASPGLDRAFT_120634 [Aspergillus glaucus CBS 516.65]